MRKILTLVAVTVFTVSSNVANADVLSEAFDDSSQFSVSTAFFSDGSDDFLGLAGAADDWGADPTPSGLKAYTGFTGSYLTGMDLDGEGAPLPITVSWTGLNIVGKTGLQFSGDFAEFFDSPGSIDASDELFVEAQIDGAGFVKILEFTPGSFSSGTSNGVFELGASTLGNAAQNFQANIVGTGSVLDLRLTANLNAVNEDFGVDNFLVTSAVPEPSSITLLGLAGLAGIVRRRR